MPNLDSLELWPRPQRLRLLAEGPGRRVGEPRLSDPSSSELKASSERLDRVLRARSSRATAGIDPSDSRRIDLSLDPSRLPRPESYRLVVSGDEIRVVGGDRAGLHHGVSTLIQLLPQAPGGRLPDLEIEDWPSLEERGVMLDVSRDKVPTMETLLALVERLSGWKVNRLQLYFEHVFAYRGHEAVWQDAGAFTAGEIRELDDFCRQRHIELVPNQNSFGHFHRWLVHEPYRALAECPEGIEHPFSPRIEPFSLCPIDPRSLELLADLYDQLLPNYRSSQFNVGLDETFDLGRGRSAKACEERGKSRVYLDFLRQVHGLAAQRGRRIQFWADILLEQPGSLGEIPGDAIAMIWGYEAGHDFDGQCRRLSATGLDFHVCPGTSSWSSFGGRLPNALANLTEALDAAREHGAKGCLVTEWGDHGHLQPQSISEIGMMIGAGLAWKGEPAIGPEEVQRLIDGRLFEDSEAVLGGVARTLGEVYLDTGGPNNNGTALFHLLVSRRDPEEIEGLSLEGLERAQGRLHDARRDLLDATSRRQDGRLIRDELAWVADVLSLACQLGRVRLENPGSALPDLPQTRRVALADDLAAVIENRKQLWLQRNRHGGLERALERLRIPLSELSRDRSPA